MARTSDLSDLRITQGALPTTTDIYGDRILVPFHGQDDSIPAPLGRRKTQAERTQTETKRKSKETVASDATPTRIVFEPVRVLYEGLSNEEWYQAECKANDALHVKRLLQHLDHYKTLPYRYQEDINQILLVLKYHPSKDWQKTVNLKAGCSPQQREEIALIFTKWTADRRAEEQKSGSHAGHAVAVMPEH